MRDINCIVSFADESGNYRKALDRLQDSLVGRFDGDFYPFKSEEELGSPTHKQIPYAFKVYAIKKAFAIGYRKILWLDASAYAIANVQPIFDLIERDGYFMQEAGHYVGTWININALNYFHLERKDTFAMPMYSAGFTGLDFRTEIATKFFAEWEAAMKGGAFNGSWVDHRHDMTCASVIANRLGMKYQKGDQYIQYAAPDVPPQNESIVIKLQGI